MTICLYSLLLSVSFRAPLSLWKDEITEIIFSPVSCDDVVTIL